MRTPYGLGEREFNQGLEKYDKHFKENNLS